MTSMNRRARKTYKKPKTRQERRRGYPRKAKGARLRPSHAPPVPHGPRPSLFCCAVPYEHCSGTANEDEKLRFHGTEEAVLSCKHHYLQKQGYTKINKREFINPETGRILVLTRTPGRVKPGKQRYMGRPMRIREM
jgi:hypothetical protein